jgi:Ca2+-binding EF-hand superfamily protein
VFIKRARIPRPDGELYQASDFGVGSVVEIRARHFHLVDADRSTRQYYKDNFLEEMPGPLPYPEDAHDRLQKEMSAMKQRPPSAGGSQPKAIDRRRQFMEFDQKVLRFSCFWDDTKKLYGEKRKFILNYFLANDTIEVREVLQPNSGRDPFPMLLRRQVLPSRDRPGELVKPMDLMCGKYVHVYSRDMLLVDCDEFTRSFYRDYFGIDQRPVPGMGDKSMRKPVSAVAEPPPTGFGSDEDSLQSHYTLNPKPPRKDIKKVQRLDRKVLRFRAKLVNPPIQDMPRRFVVAVYLVDDTVSIFEPPQRNSGIVGGKFLERGKFRHMEPPEGGPPRFFFPHDFYVGARIPLEFCPHQQLEILEADAFTLKFCEGSCRQFRKSDIELVNRHLASALATHTAVDLRDFFAGRDPRNTGSIKSGDLQKALRSLGVFDELHIQERITLARRYDDNDDGQFAYHELCDDLSRAMEQMQPSAAQTAQGHGIDATLCKLRASATSLRKVFRRVDKGDGQIDIDEYLDLLDFYQIEVTEADAREAFAQFDQNGNGSVDYNEFCDAMYPCEFSGGRGGGGSNNRNNRGGGGGGVGGGGRVGGRERRNSSGDAWGEETLDSGRSGGRGGVGGAGGNIGNISNPAIALIVKRYFAGKKYELHKQFRKRDHSQSGQADEDAFIEALTAANPQISDDEKFELALHFFPNAGDEIEYKDWISKTFG